MKPKHVLFYSTLRCNAACEFCPIWQLSPDQQTLETDPRLIIDNLHLARRQGGKQLLVTGGEPLLRDDLPQILEAAKQLGFRIELSTNGILYADKGRALKAWVDRWLFSIDYPIASEHDRSRGVECFSEVISALKSTNNSAINFTITRDSIRYLPEMVELAERLNKVIQILPVHDFQGTQGFEPITLEHIKYYSRHRLVVVDLALLQFIKDGGNQVLFPRCRAQETTLTIAPDGQLIKPCFFNPAGRQGKENVCSCCMRWPYMLPSLSSAWDKYRLLALYSNWLNRAKVL
ncbi:hypothetical protein A2311_06005 [candidate division WOR-1 bacterium RIFOXYB2_FULL_48_7]|uniref:Radical SAM core domain-containing protein n=1 Tax=candidate division WOR-1 bacterium RIFOXYB2_FULL_48_7 TaxID=1802583 RepID=A0A1F4TSK9_UNCSA|nr:MAG: hypothetical protein A2311_06005 [candidate division WOR-1 bacterium RIFOXYB2_FULL_48_7]